jgi:hypothetical protein
VMGDPADKHAKRRHDIADVVGQVEAKWACEASRSRQTSHALPWPTRNRQDHARCAGPRACFETSTLTTPLRCRLCTQLPGFNLADELITRPPYSDPHHSASVASIVGGGQRMARPGAISCAHKGVLFLDDSTEPQSIRLSREFVTPPPRGGSANACATSTVLVPFLHSPVELTSFQRLGCLHLEARH